MTDKEAKSPASSYENYLSGLSPKEWDTAAERGRKQGEKEHKAFHEKFVAGKCWICSDALTAFDAAKPCPHWLLNPVGFRKEHFDLLTQKFSLIKLEHYLRWVANEEAFAKNINDLVDEGSGKLVELTIKYKNLQWSFSCSANDLGGHEGGGEHSKRPHWHFQMYVNDKPLIRYKDFHASLSERDIGLLEYMRKNPKLRRRFAGGTSMGDILHKSRLEQVVGGAGKSTFTDEDAHAAPIELSTIVVAEPGKSIRGEDIYNLVQAAKAENVTVTSKLRALKGASISTIVSAGPGVVRQAVRSGRKKRRKDRATVQEDRQWRERLKRQIDATD